MKFQMKTAFFPTLVQSTCTSVFSEAKSPLMQNMQGTFQARSSSNFSNIDTVRYKESTKHERESIDHNDGTTSTYFSYFLSTFGQNFSLFC